MPGTDKHTPLQTLAFGNADDKPAGHEPQYCEPALLNWPAGQTPEQLALVKPMALPNRPAAHGEQTPGAEPYVPYGPGSRNKPHEPTNKPA